MSDIIAEPQSDNEALRRILANLEALVAQEAKNYTDVDGSNAITVTQSITLIRDAYPTSLKASVTNLGLEKVTIYEGPIEEVIEHGQEDEPDTITIILPPIVAVLYPDQTWESPLGGKLELRGKCALGKSTIVALAYYKP